MFFSRCLGVLFPPRFPPNLEQLYAAHKTEGIGGRCLLHALSYTLVLSVLSLSFFNLAAVTHTLFAVTYRVQVAAVGIATLLYTIMFIAHKLDGAFSRKLRTFNDAAQTIPAVYICMVAPVVEPYRLMKLLGSTYAEEIGKWVAGRTEGLGLKETCGGYVQGSESDTVCAFASYEALVVAAIIHVMTSAAIFGRTSPRWIFVAWHWNFAWYVFVRSALGDINSHGAIFRQDACILYITLGLLYMSGRRVDQLLRAEFMHTREMGQRVDAISRVHTHAAVHEAADGVKPLRRSLSWPGKSISCSNSSFNQHAPETLPARLTYISASTSSTSSSTHAGSLPPGPPSSSAGRSAIELPVETHNWLDASIPAWLKNSAARTAETQCVEVAPEAAVSLAAEVSFGQDLVTEALAELANKEEAVAAQQVRLVPMSASGAFQVRAAHQMRVASEDAYAKPNSPEHGSTSSETSTSHSFISPEWCIQLTDASPQITLQDEFGMHVMCNFTPKHPSELPKSKWVSYRRLLYLFQPHAPTEVWQHGPGNLKQLLTDWFKDHPVFVGLEVSDWCKLLKDKDASPGSSSLVSKFSFEYTPNRKRGFGLLNNDDRLAPCREVIKP